MIEIPKSVGEISRNSTACDVGEITNEEADLDLKKFKEEIVETKKIEPKKQPKKTKVPEQPKKPMIPKPTKIPEPKKPDPEEPRDVIREYVLQEEEKIAKRRSKMPLKFKDLKPVCVAKNRAKNREKLQRSWSTNRLPTESTKNSNHSNVSKMANFSRHSIER